MKPRLVYLRTAQDQRRGFLTAVEYGNESVLPFLPKRAFWIYNVPSGEVRGGHGHKEIDQFLIAVSGEVVVHCNGVDYGLTNPMVGLHVPPGNITYQEFASDDAILLVLASDIYDPKEYLYADGAR